MVYFPEFWYLGENTEDGWRIYITEDSGLGSQLGFIHIPASLVGAYKGIYLGPGLRSISNGNYVIENSISGYHDGATFRGTGYHLMDYQQHCIVSWMFMLKYKTRNSQSVCGAGTKSKVRSGSTNSLGMTDTTPETAPNTGSVHVNFLGLEGCWGCMYELIEGLHIHPSDGVIAYDKGYYSSSTRYSDVSSETKRILTTGNSTGGTTISTIFGGKYMDMVGSSYVSNAYSQYFCDGGAYLSSSAFVPVRGYYSNTDSGGVFSLFMNAFTEGSSNSDMVSRLAYDGTINILSNEEYKKKW